MFDHRQDSVNLFSFARQKLNDYVLLAACEKKQYVVVRVHVRQEDPYLKVSSLSEEIRGTRGIRRDWIHIFFFLSSQGAPPQLLTP